MTSACAGVRPRLSEYVDQHLDPGSADEIRAHLATCEECRGLAADLDRVSGVARSLGPIQPPAHLWLEVAGRIRQEEGTAAPVPTAPPTEADLPSTGGTWQWLGLAAALTLVTLGVYSLGQPDPAEPSTMVDAGSGNATEDRKSVV